jgi:hypothetical protein
MQQNLQAVVVLNKSTCGVQFGREKTMLRQQRCFESLTVLTIFYQNDRYYG